MNERETLKTGKNGRLIIGGADVKELAEKYGTPLYVMDKKHVKDMCEVFSETLKSEYGEGLVTYASKAFCCKEMYRIVNECGLGADVVSGGELYTAIKSGFPAEKLTFHGNNKSFEELYEAVTCGVGEIVIDSLKEIDVLNDVCLKTGKKQNVLIRVNPGIEAHTHHYIQTAKQDSKFGFSITDGSADVAVKSAKKAAMLNLKGLHCHIGSQIFEKKSFILAVDKMTDYYRYVKESFGIDFSVLNLGGGFGIYYAEGDLKLAVSDYAEYVKTICRELKTCVSEKGITKPFLMLEPGRSIVGEAGITLYTVGRIKEIKGIKNYLAVNGGMFDNPRYALYQARYTVAAAERMNDIAVKNYSIAGKCCESGDLIAEDCMLPEMREGELLAVFSTGAYNYSMSSNYNRNLIPPVVMVENGMSYYAVKPQTYDDLLRNDV